MGRAPRVNSDIPTQLRALAAELDRRVSGEVRFDAGSRSAYSTDASSYRQVPIGVVIPKTPEAAVEAVAVCREHDVPILSRGGGTSLAGQCCNAAVVIDWSKYCTRVDAVDTRTTTAIVEPGIKLDALNRHLEPYAMMLGPKPSTHVSCTIGGMIGNNSCGSTAQAYGKMADAVRRLEVLTYDGTRMWVGNTDNAEVDRLVAADDDKARYYRGLRSIIERHGAQIRARYPDIPRRVSGYNLDSLLPENGFQLARALVGSESTLVTVLRAEIHLVDVPAAKSLAILGFADVGAAADAVPTVLEHQPAAVEGIDQHVVSLEHSRRLAHDALRELPPGQAWLLVQLNGEDQREANDKARTLADHLAAANSAQSLVVDDPGRLEQLWAARDAALGATAYLPDGTQTLAGWEDAAVPPERLGDYLRGFRRLLERYDYGSASLYGHFGQGCVHTRIPFDLRTAEGIERYHRFTVDAAHLVVDFGGSLSGEHGDGQSRGELLPIMFGDRIVRAFEEVKALFDPDNRMNPGKVVKPYRNTDNLRQGVTYLPLEPKTAFAYPDVGHRFSNAANRCVGVGKCRSEQSGVMCPSYRATKEEEHSTRGRSRLLFEMLRGEVITDGWRSTAVRDALDLCLACKGCRSDCPVNVDMATYKAEFLHHHYRRRLRPMSHYSMGWLPLLARAAAALPGPVNTVTHAPAIATTLKALGGIDTQRTIPYFAPARFSAVAGAENTPGGGGSRGTVVLWPDTFVNNFDTDVARDALAVLQSAGFDVQVPRRTACCGLTWISTGQLSVAKRVLRRTLKILRPALRAGTPIVVLEPSCAAVFRSDAPELLYGDEDARRLAEQTYTIGELLQRKAGDWTPPQRPAQAMVQPHCHQHAVLHYDDDRRALEKVGVSVEVLDAGCCGLAGNFGFEKGHYDISVACAEDQLLPALRNADPATLVVADGFSCRTQIKELTSGIRALHTAQVLARALRGSEADQKPDAVPLPK